MRREQSEKMAFAKFMIALLRPISGITEREASLLLSDYGEAVYQLKYNSKYVSMREQFEHTEVKQKLEDLRILEKVSKFMVKD